MGCEVQKPVKFDEIVAGDEIVMEVFSPDNTRFIGDYRGTAKHLSYQASGSGAYVWHFDGMDRLYSDTSVNYRLFKVMPPTQAELDRDELRDLREMKGRVESLLRLKQAQLRIERKCAETSSAGLNRDLRIATTDFIEKQAVELETAIRGTLENNDNEKED